MNVSKLCAWLALPVTLWAATPSSAAVTYSFKGDGDLEGVSFSVTQPGFASNGEVVFSPQTQTGGVSFIGFCLPSGPVSSCGPVNGAASLTLTSETFAEASVVFNGNPFGSTGVFFPSEGSAYFGVLTIGGTPDLMQSAVPEPVTWAMMLIGFGMVGATSRYRRRSLRASLA